MEIWQIKHGPNRGAWAWRIQADPVELPGKNAKRFAQRAGLCLDEYHARGHATRAARLHERLAAMPHPRIPAKQER